MKKPLLKIGLFLLLLFSGCASDSESDLMNPETPPENTGMITYDANIRSIISSNCVSCHSSPPVNGAPFALTTYAQVKSVGQSGALITAISKQTGQTGAMPPTGRLPQATIDLIQKWIDNGMPEK